MSFRDAANRMFALYRQGDYEGALGVVRQARRDYPEQDNRLTFWEACLLARAGQPEDSLVALRSGLERGRWWPTGQLADTDLDSIRSTPEFKAIFRRCEQITDERKADRPVPIVSEATTGGTLVSIQGAHADQTGVASLWQDTAPPGWGVITPAGSEPNPDGGWTWPHSLELSVQSVLDDIQGLTATHPFVLSGFSIGAAIASHIINSYDQQIDGVIAVAPASPGASNFAELIEASSHTPTLVIGGDQDPRATRYTELQEELSSRPHVTVQIIENLGHANPPDLATRVQGFLGQLTPPVT